MYHWGSYDKKPFVLDYINTWDRGKRLENGFSKREAEEGEEDRKLLRLSCLGEKKGET